MKTRIAVLVLSCTWAAPGQAAELPRSPEDSVQICGSLNCIRIAWDYFEWCWFGSGLERDMQMQALDDLSFWTKGVPYSFPRHSIFWNEPQFVDSKVRTNLRNIDLIGSSLYGYTESKSSLFDSLAGSSLGSGSGLGSGSTPFTYTAQLGNGLSVEIPVTDSGKPRYPVEYVKTCDTYGKGFYYIPGNETCIRIGGYISSTQWIGQGGQQYESQTPKQAPKLTYGYNWSAGGALNYKFDSKVGSYVKYDYDSSDDEERPVEYNKICEANGKGFFYIPGTDTCLKLTGGLAYQEYSALRNRITTTLADPPEVKTNVDQPKLPQREASTNTPQPEVKTSVEQPKLPQREVLNTQKGSPVTNKDTKAPEPAKPQLSSTPRWVDAKTGAPVQVGPEGTRTGLFDSSEAFNPETGKSYRKENGVWKDVKSGETVPELPIHSKASKDDPNSATHSYSGRQFRFEGGKQPTPPQQPANAAAPPAQAPSPAGGQWVDAKTGKAVPVGPAGTRPGLFDQNEAFNPNTGKSYKKENGVWKDQATGKEVPEIPINSQPDANDPGKAKHSYNDRTFIKVSPQAQADTKADRTRKKSEEAKARLSSLPPGPERIQLEADIVLLEKGLDPDEENAKFAARVERSEQVIKDLEDIQIPTALSLHREAKQVYDKEKTALDMMPKDGPSADAKKRAEQEKKVRQADRNMFNAANKYWKLNADLKTFKAQYEKYRVIRELTPEERARQIADQVKEFSESFRKADQAEQKAIESRYGNVPDQMGKPAGASKSGEGKPAPAKSKGPQRAAKDAPASPKQAERAPEPRDETAIRINIKASIWGSETSSDEKKPEPFMVNFRPGYTVPLDLDLKSDVGYDEAPSLAIVRDGTGTFEVAYDQRQSVGLALANPGSNFLINMLMPKLSEFVMESAADAAGIPAQLPMDRWLPEGAEEYRETINIDGMPYIRIGVRERFEMAREWMTLLALAQHYNVNPARLAEDWCWQKLPAYELEPASSTAHGEGLPHATLVLSSVRTGSAEQ